MFLISKFLCKIMFKSKKDLRKCLIDLTKILHSNVRIFYLIQMLFVLLGLKNIFVQK